MVFLLANLPLRLGEEDDPVAAILARTLGGRAGDFRNASFERLSLDARHKGSIHYLATLRFETDRGLETLGLNLPSGAHIAEAKAAPNFTVAPLFHKPRVVIVGSGPAGTFCALRLLDYGIEPILLERGPTMEERVKFVSELWTLGKLNPCANAQFGEGGAGTFSDGKLATRIGHPGIRFVLDTFVHFGASSKIIYHAKPHVGTDVIRQCAVRMRQEAERRGAQYRWNATLVDIQFNRGAVSGALLDSGEEIPCDALVLAPGHSARDTFEMLHQHGVAMRPKPFAMGLRVEHPQSLIDHAQYGPSAGNGSLPPADYRLVCNLGPDRAVYSFCMCPGGEVIQCASEEGGVVVNGMSTSRRDSGFANSGLVAKVNTTDFASDHPLAGMHLQRHWEQAAYRAAGETYGAPAMALLDFHQRRPTGKLPRNRFRPTAVPADLDGCLPGFVLEQLRSALPAFDRKLRGFLSSEALLLGIESRTSCPVQLLRGADGASLSHAGLYPCGEGAGFAGGITSAAVDGLRVAEWIAQKAGAPPCIPLEKGTGLSRSGDEP